MRSFNVSTKATLEKRQFFGHWRWIHKRPCSCGYVMRILGGDTRREPSLPPGAVVCVKCGERVTL
jgi:hypothetical protein